MTRYQVEWQPEALDTLAHLWMIAKDRKAVTEAEARIHHLLTVNPWDQGLLLSEGLWKLVIPPLVVSFSVREDVPVIDVWTVKMSLSE